MNLQSLRQQILFRFELKEGRRRGSQCKEHRSQSLKVSRARNNSMDIIEEVGMETETNLATLLGYDENIDRSMSLSMSTSSRYFPYHSSHSYPNLLKEEKGEREEEASSGNYYKWRHDIPGPCCLPCHRDLSLLSNN